MFYQVFFSPQIKRCAIITYKHGIYELPHELSNDLRLTILSNDLPNDLRLKDPDPRDLGNFRKVSKPHRIIP